MRIVLFEPDIPQNTGNISRTCSVTNTSLVLVRPLGFSLSNRMRKRASLDYWDEVSLEIIDDLPSYLEKNSSFYFFSSKAKKSFTDVSFSQESHLIFGSETKGLPPSFLEQWPEKFVTIPMKTNARCLNLSNAVAIGLYEALRQQGFSSLI
jgi:tRNA (cytidine/uridine-2'-O-)-methyltransferase